MRKIKFTSKKNDHKELFVVIGCCTACSAVITTAVVVGYTKLKEQINQTETILRHLWERK